MWLDAVQFNLWIKAGWDLEWLEDFLVPKNQQMSHCLTVPAEAGKGYSHWARLTDTKFLRLQPRSPAHSTGWRDRKTWSRAAHRSLCAGLLPHPHPTVVPGPPRPAQDTRVSGCPVCPPLKPIWPSLNLEACRKWLKTAYKCDDTN